MCCFIEYTFRSIITPGITVVLQSDYIDCKKASAHLQKQGFVFDFEKNRYQNDKATAFIRRGCLRKSELDSIVNNGQGVVYINL